MTRCPRAASPSESSWATRSMPPRLCPARGKLYVTTAMRTGRPRCPEVSAPSRSTPVASEGSAGASHRSLQRGIDRVEGAAHPLRRKVTLHGGGSALAQPSSKGRVAASREICRSQVRDISWAVRDHGVFRLADFAGAAGIAHNHRPAARHGFGDDQAKRLRLGTGVHDDIQCAVDGRRLRLKLQKANPTTKPKPGGQRLQGCRGSTGWRPVWYTGPPTTYARTGSRGSQARHRTEKDLVAFPPGVGPHQANAHRVDGAGRSPAAASRSCDGPSGRKRVRVDAVMQHVDPRGPRHESPARPLPHFQSWQGCRSLGPRNGETARPTSPECSHSHGRATPDGSFRRRPTTTGHAP